MTDRVVALVDMDCFYCQVEERLNPELKGKPTVVVQYNPWKGGGIIAVNYEARAQGVKRGMRGDLAKKLCPDVVLCSVPMIREKADLNRYRDAGREVVDVMCKFSTCVQRASIDEAYLDLTNEVEKRLPNFMNALAASNIPNTFVVGYTPDSTNEEVERTEGTNSWLKELFSSGLNDVDAKKLAVGAIIVEEMRKAILEVTGFKCSAGIAHNKILAKLAAGIHKPNRQTVIPQASVAQLYTSLPVHKIRSLGGKLGRELEDVHGVKVMADLLKFSQADLIRLCDERMGNWLYQIARGHDSEPVTARLVSKSIACCKNFPGRMSLCQGKEVEHWLNKLTEELLERLMEDETLNARKAQHMVFSIRLQEGRKEIASSKSVPLNGYYHDKIVNSARSCLKKFCTQDPVTKVWSPIITFLGLSAGKFSDTSNKLKQLFDAMKNNRPKIDDTGKLGLSGLEPSLKDESSPAKVLPRQSNCNSGSSIGFPSELRESPYFEKMSKPSISISPEPKKRESQTADTPPGAVDETLNHSSLEETAGPSFFERMLLDNVVSNGKRVKLNLMPIVPQTSPRKPPDPLDLLQPTTVDKNITNKLNDFSGSKSTVSGAAGRHNENNKMSKPSKDDISSFFGKNPQWVDPLEIFPDIEGIDETTLALFPVSYQKRILEMKKSKEKHVDLGGEMCSKSAKDPCVEGLKVCTDGSLSKDSICSGEVTDGCVSKSTLSVPKTEAKTKPPTIHDSQQPSTSKCGLYEELPQGCRSYGSSPEDMFAEPFHDAPLCFSDDSNPSTANLSCPDCQMCLSVEDFEEHRDYHFALRLQEEMNQPSPRPAPVVTTKSLAFKRKSNAKTTKHPDPKKIKSIDSFFKKPS